MASAMTDDRIAVLEAKIARLEAMIATRDEPDAHPPTDESSADVAPVSSRRRLLRNVVIATSGVVAGALAGGATPAAAADPNDLVLGATSTGGVGTFNTSGAPTHAKYLGGLTPTANAFLFEAGNNYTNTSSHPSALAAYTNDAEKVNGVYGRTARFDASGVIGESIAASGTGVLGIGPYGVVGRTAVAFGAGVRGEGVEFGVEGVASSPSGAGTRGTGGTGVVGVSIGGPNAEGYGVAGASLVGTGVAGAGQTYGLESVQSNRAAMLLRADPYDAGAVRIAPPSRTDFHLNGEIEYDINSDLWLCVYPGNPGAWRKLSGPGVAGAFHAVTPGRVYDSRVANPSPGILDNNQRRTISVASRRELVNGDVVESDFVPAGATAVACNVGVVDTQRSGFLTINPGGINEINSASINWSASGQILNNGVMLTLNVDRELTVICGGGGATNFVLDITGYFR